jgi:hypothetical protein
MTAWVRDVSLQTSHHNAEVEPLLLLLMRCCCCCCCWAAAAEERCVWSQGHHQRCYTAWQRCSGAGRGTRPQAGDNGTTMACHEPIMHSKGASWMHIDC